MFFDHLKIHVVAGRGGNGSVSFRREAHVPKGGPDGGDGGHGGNVEVVCDASLRDLAQYRGQSELKAENGHHGEGSRRHGSTGSPLEIHVPPGTRVTRVDQSIEVELSEHGERVVVARGGTGGRGNKQFATSTQQAPRFAENGLSGEAVELDLQLRLLADAGLVGLPNAGKSSLLDRMTAATPKVADYPFTTVQPVLGTLDSDDRQLVIVDIPGLIEGAHDGAGLGHEFLAHVERCKLLVHVLDLAPLDGSDPAENFETVERELAEHDQRLAGLPRILALSKADLVAPEVAEEAADRWRAKLQNRVLAVVVTSSATQLGLNTLRDAIFKHTPTGGEQPKGPLAPWESARGGAEESFADRPEHRTYRPIGDEGFTVEEVERGLYRINGKGIELLIERFDTGNDEALRHVEQRMRSIGVIRELERKGFETGDEIEIGDVRFELEI